MTMSSSCVHRALAAALAALAGRASASPAQAVGAGGPAATPANVTYETFAYPDGPTTLCPGQSLTIRAAVNRVTTRGGSAASGVASQSTPNAQLDPLLSDPGVGTINPSTTAIIGATPHQLGGFQTSFLFTARKIGTTTLRISGVVLAARLGQPLIRAAPARPITIRVACDYKISLYSTWQHPGERTLDILGVVQSVRITPNASGRFSTRGTLSSTAVWIGGCAGVSRIQRSQVTIYGEVGGLDPSGLPEPVHVMVLYDPVSSTTTEGCYGKSQSDQGKPEQLDLRLNPYGDTQTPSHVLVTSPRVTGSTTVVLTRVTP
jgi:hypothetical protein